MIYVSSSFSLFLAVSIVLIALFPKCGSQTSNEKNPGCFGYGIGDYTAQLCGDYSKQLTTSITESKSFFFFLVWLNWGSWDDNLQSSLRYLSYYIFMSPILNLCCSNFETRLQRPCSTGQSLEPGASHLQQWCHGLILEATVWPSRPPPTHATHGSLGSGKI